MGPAVAAYVDYVLKTPGIQRHRFLRELLALSRKVTEGVFVEALQRALRYRILDMATLHRIAWFCMSQGEEQRFEVDVDVLAWQRKRFVTHIEAARQCQLPLIVHTRDAKQDTLDILRRHRADEVGGVLHCFTEDWEMARAAIDLDFYISISGIVTFAQAQNVRDMARQIPLERLLIETDSPWLSPAPFRGKTNHPGRVSLVAQKLAEIRGESLQTLASATYANANRLFRL